MAETDPDPDQQRYYLNTVRNNRGLTNLVAGADMPAEIQKAYQKEFWGEGQLFFYYKRKALTTVPSGNSLGTITNGAAGSFYDVDKKAFAQNASYNSVVLNAPASSLNYPSGYNLIYMDKDYNNNAFAILEDPATSDRYLMRFPIGGAQTYFQKITGTDIAQATHFASSPAFGYLFYSVGGKVYEYDLSLRTSILMIDKGASNITYLNFQHFFNRGTSTVNPKYSTWADYLNVVSYGSSETSGTFELYNIPPINGQLTLVPGCSWTGFGEIVSVSYRER